LRAQFIWDDQYTIVTNPIIRDWSPAHLRAGFQTGLFGDPQGHDFYRPFVTLVDRIDFSFYGLKPWGYHLTNLLLHMANSLLVWLLILRLGFKPRVAFLTSTLFAVHPINIQDMVMVTGRCGLLGLFFTLATLLFLMRRNGAAIVGAALCYACGLLSKESVCVAPFLFLAIADLQRTWRWRQIGARLVVLVGITIFYGALRPAANAVWPPEIPHTLWLLFLLHMFPKVLLLYAALMTMPVLLYTDRGLPVIPVSGLLLTMALTGIGYWLWRRRERWPFFSFVWVFITLLPPSLLMVSRSLLYDHWAYPALPGFLLPIAIAGAHGLASARATIRTATRWILGLLLTAWIVLAQAHTLVRLTNRDFFRWSARFSAADTMRHNLDYMP